MVVFASSYSQVLTRFVVESTIAVYRNSVQKTRNIFVECGNVCNTLIPQFINAVDSSIIFINPFLVNFLHFIYWLEHSVLILFASMHQIKIVS